MLALVRAVAANWNLRRPLKIPQADQLSTFFAAMTADTFIQLNADHPDPLTPVLAAGCGTS
jgi:hypothetical protein